jgi:hypothetical protein
LLSLLGFVAFAADDQQMEEILVTVAPANICYKALVLNIKGRGIFVQSISVQVLCHDKPAKILPLLQIQKVGETCGYTVGKFINLVSTHPLNQQHKFNVLGRCTTTDK